MQDRQMCIAAVGSRSTYENVDLIRRIINVEDVQPGFVQKAAHLWYVA